MEDEVNISDFGYGDDPACWTQIGYASGYTSTFMGRLVVYREVECRSQGDTQCRIVGQVSDRWNDDAYVAYFRPQPFAAQLIDYQIGLDQLRSVQARRRFDSKLVGVSAGFRAAFNMLAHAAANAVTVLLLGETGVGKEVFARWLHESGPRSKGPFIAVNCAAIPHELIEAELFGVEKGAYTGAHLARAGRFERAHSGTLFLDEIGDLPLAAQVKLLRALQTGEVERLGSETSVPFDVRIVAATNVDLHKAMQDGRFRVDLFYRLNTFPITIPPLRERAADIPALVERFVDRFSELYRKKVLGLTDKAMRTVLGHAWPGNIRELENAIERAVLLAPDNGYIEASHLPVDATSHSGGQLDARGVVTEASHDVTDEICTQVLDRRIDLAVKCQQVLS